MPNTISANKIIFLLAWSGPFRQKTLTMKPRHMLLALGVASTTAFAGTPYVAPAPAPAPAPAALGWFIGGSYGQFDVDNNLESVLYDASLLDITNIIGQDNIGDYLDGLNDDDYFDLLDAFDETFDELDLDPRNFGEDDLLDVLDEITLGDFSSALPTGYGINTEVSDVEFDMYTFHFGRELGCASGFDMSAYLEIGWLTGDMTLSADLLTPGGKINLFEESLDLDIIPVTANFKVEHVIYGPVGAYLSGGVGYAWTNIESDDLDIDESDGGFYAQAAAGLVWNVNESFEVFGGARWVHLESLDFGDSSFELEDTLGWEVGARFNF